jgi:glycosyltransferase involved in cell wall biosynthesis
MTRGEPRLLYLTLDPAVHDFRFVRGYRAAGLAVQPVVLGPPAKGHAALRALHARDGNSLRAIAARWKPTFVQAGPLTPVAEVARRELPDIPLIAVSWAHDVLSGQHHTRQRNVLRQAAVLLCDSLVVYETCCAIAGPLKAIIFPWGLERVSRTRRAAPARVVRLVSLRSLEPQYRPEVAIKAARLLTCHFHFYGAGSLTALARAHIYFSTSPIDGTSVSLLEAMRSGAVPVVPHIPGNREWVVHGVNGWLYTPCSARGFCGAVLDALQRRREWPKIRRTNRKLVQLRADWPTSIGRFVALLRDGSLSDLPLLEPTFLDR